MSRNGPSQVELSKTIRGALKAGLDVQRVEVGPDGKIILIIQKAGPVEVAA